MAPPQDVVHLVEHFDRNADAYRSGNYNEAQLRQEFLNPFFVALGWDVENREGFAEAYKDVIHEDSVKIEGETKAPDYSFRIGETRKFFVEAKKPSINLRDDPRPAFQLRRYAWTVKLPLSLLTSFAELAVYDCRVQPFQSDKASTARVSYYSYHQYLEQWDELAGRFSKDAVWKGSFDKFIESTRAKKGTAEVDEAFLGEIEEWRKELASNIALRNPKLSQREVNFAVQRTIDRIIFLRICEDRGIEKYGQLRELQREADVYRALCTIFERADERYNSGLFHFQKEKDRAEAPDELTLRLRIDDAKLKAIFKRIYYPESSYEFSVLPADILGQVYEQFLGKIIHLTAGHFARVEDKPEVKKAGGVYYTPTYIVDYIVKGTVGEIVEGKTPKQAAKLRVLDPACGSGSFLIAAYQYLINWHRDRYLEEGAEKHRKELYQSSGGTWRLTISEKKRILRNNIYGVDIDAQAVEVTKLSLLLKVLEGESEQTLNTTYRMFHERALPDLGDNIKCGNSLIGPDLYDGTQMSLLGDELHYRINAFNWNSEFPGIIGAGGFDAVIGNPPYIRVRIFKQFYPDEAEYLEARYSCAHHVWDVYLLFLEKALQLTRSDGRFGFIVPIQTLHQPNCQSIRELLLHNCAVKSVVDLSHLKVFVGPIVKNCVLIMAKEPQHKKNQIRLLAPASIGQLNDNAWREWSQARVLGNPGLSLKLDLLSPKRDLCEKLRGRSWVLDDLCYVTFGLRSCAPGRGKGGKDRLIVENAEHREAKPYLEGRDIGRYALNPTGRFIRYLPEKMYSPRTPRLFETKKIVSQTMLSRMRIIATLDTSGFYVEQSLACIVPHGIADDRAPAADLPLEFVLGIINSRLEAFYFATYIIDYSLGGGLIHATPGSQSQLIVPKVGPEEVGRIIAEVKQMLSLHVSLGNARLDHDRVALERQIEATNRHIDCLVYELYGLTEGEIAAIEGFAQFEKNPLTSVHQ